MDRPIPAFYCCYLLRSTVKHSSVYVGSTPNPVRRLAQHNGVIKGGAVRTSRISLRPWEMTCIVTGFPSHIAALQFEWAWQNPHVTLHIPPESRIQHATSKKQSGHPKRPRHTVSSLLSNLHILLSVPSFSRWPLELLFFSESVQKIWQKSCKISVNKVPESIILTLDSDPTEPPALGSSPRGKNNKSLHGIKALTVDYCDYKPHVEKAKEIIEFEQEGSCSVCQVKLEHSKGIYTVCPGSGCEAVTHMTCLSRHFLQSEADAVIPIKGTCPSCRSQVRWVDIVKELSLRMRGQTEVEKLLKVRKIVKGKRKDASDFQALDSSGEEDDALEACMEFNPEPDSETVDRWQASDDRDGSDFESTTSNGSRTRSRLTRQSACSALAIEDSDWEDAPLLD